MGINPQGVTDMIKITGTKSYCNPPGCRCPIIEVLSESRTNEIVAIHIREIDAPGVRLILDYCEGDFSTHEKIDTALEIFIKSIGKYREDLARDAAEMAGTEN